MFQRLRLFLRVVRVQFWLDGNQFKHVTDKDTDNYFIHTYGHLFQNFPLLHFWFLWLQMLFFWVDLWIMSWPVLDFFIFICFSCLYKPHCPLFFSRPYIFPTQLFHSFEWLFCVTVVMLMLMDNAYGTRSHSYDQIAATFPDYLRYSLH